MFEVHCIVFVTILCYCMYFILILQYRSRATEKKNYLVQKEIIAETQIMVKITQ